MAKEKAKRNTSTTRIRYTKASPKVVESPEAALMPDAEGMKEMAEKYHAATTARPPWYRRPPRGWFQKREAI